MPFENKVAPVPVQRTTRTGAKEVVKVKPEPEEESATAVAAAGGAGSGASGKRRKEFSGASHASVARDLASFEETLGKDPRVTLVNRRNELREAIAAAGGKRKGAKKGSLEEELANIEEELRSALKTSEEIMKHIEEEVGSRQVIPLDQQGADVAIHDVIASDAAVMQVSDLQRRQEVFVEQILRQSAAEREVVARLAQVRLQKEAMKAHRIEREKAYEERHRQLWAKREEMSGEVTQEQRDAYARQLESAKVRIAELQERHAEQRRAKHERMARRMVDDLVDLSMSVAHHREQTARRATPWGSSEDTADVLQTTPQYREWVAKWVSGLPQANSEASELEEADAPQRQLDAVQLAAFLSGDSGFALVEASELTHLERDKVQSLSDLAIREGDETLGGIIRELSLVVEGDSAAGTFAEYLHPRSLEELQSDRRERVTEAERKLLVQERRATAPLEPLRVAVTGTRLSGQSALATLLSTTFSLTIVSPATVVSEAVGQFLAADANILAEKEATWKRAAESASQALSAGKSISAKVTAQLLAAQLLELEARPTERDDELPYGGWVLDGFPRTREEGTCLEEALSGSKRKSGSKDAIATSQLDLVVQLECPLDVALARMAKAQLSSDELPIANVQNGAAAGETVPDPDIATVTAEIEAYQPEFQLLQDHLTSFVGRYEADLALRTAQAGKSAQKSAAQTSLAKAPRVVLGVPMEMETTRSEISAAPVDRIRSFVAEQRARIAAAEHEKQVAEEAQRAQQEKERGQDEILQRAKEQAEEREAAAAASVSEKRGTRAKGKGRARPASRGGPPELSAGEAELIEASEAIERERKEQAEQELKEREQTEAAERFAILANPLSLLSTVHEQQLKTLSATPDAADVTAPEDAPPTETDVARLLNGVTDFEGVYVERLCDAFRSLRQQRVSEATMVERACSEAVDFMNGQAESESSFQKGYDAFVGSLAEEESLLTGATAARLSTADSKRNPRRKQGKPSKTEAALAQFEERAEGGQNAARTLVEAKLPELKSQLWAISDSRREGAEERGRELTALTGDAVLAQHIEREQQAFSVVLANEQNRLAATAAILRDVTRIIVNEGRDMSPADSKIENKSPVHLELPTTAKQLRSPRAASPSSATDSKKPVRAKREQVVEQQAGAMEGELVQRVVEKLFPDRDAADSRSLVSELAARTSSGLSLTVFALALCRMRDPQAEGGAFASRRPSDVKIANKKTQRKGRKEKTDEPELLAEVPEPPLWLDADTSIALVAFSRDQLLVEQEQRTRYEETLRSRQEAAEAKRRAAEEASAAESETKEEGESDAKPVIEEPENGSDDVVSDPEPDIIEPGPVELLNSVIAKCAAEQMAAFEQRVTSLQELFVRRIVQLLSTVFVQTSSSIDSWVGMRFKKECVNVENILDHVLASEALAEINESDGSPETSIGRLQTAIASLREVRVDSLSFRIERSPAIEIEVNGPDDRVRA
jgi:CPC1/SPEF2 domain D5